jgi:hypothetical protein
MRFKALNSRLTVAGLALAACRRAAYAVIRSAVMSSARESPNAARRCAMAETARGSRRWFAR